MATAATTSPIKALAPTTAGFRSGCRRLAAARGPATSWLPTSLAGPRNRVAPSLVVNAAKKGGGKKGGGKKGGGKKKVPGSLMDIAKKKEPFEDVTVVMQNLLMVESFRRNVGRPLMENVEINEAAKAIFQADFVMITCDRGLSAEPKIVYVNAEGLKLLDKTWEEVIDSPASSILKLEELSDAQEKGALDGYCGPVETAAGSVAVKDATVWTVESPAIVGGEEGADDVEASKTSRGKIMGQGIVFKEWTLPDGTAGGVGIVNVAPPSIEDIQQAEQAVTDQGEVVRSLKESGLTNQDGEVMDAVEELLQRKARLSELQELLAMADSK